MGTALKIKALGNSSAVILPKEVMTRLKVQKGDTLYALNTANGIELTPYDESFAAEMEAGRRVMKKYRNALRKLAE